MKEGKRAKYTSQTTEIWKGKYSEEGVAIKILRVYRDDPLAQRVKSVSALRDSRTRVFSCAVLTKNRSTAWKRF